MKKNRYDEHALIAAIKQGGPEKNKYVKLLIADHQGYVYKLRVETGLSEETLKDIFTDTVLLVLEHIENDIFRSESRLSSYFYKIFYFKTIDHIRKNASNKIDYTDDLPELGDDGQNITRIVELKDEMNMIIKVLDDMCFPCRDIIMDWAYWGFKSEEIGERIGETDPVKFARIKYNCIHKFKKLWSEKMAVSQNPRLV
jgi:RNA polymerase sigma factor (sigma-70 family)